MLNGVNFKVKAGQTVAIIGRTGSGKTTIINLLSRMLETTSGDILLDGISIKELEKTPFKKTNGDSTTRTVLIF